MTGANVVPDRNPWGVEESDFLQIVLGPDEEGPFRGGKLRLLSVELYRDGIILTWLAHSYSSIAHAVALDALRRQPDFTQRVESWQARSREQGLPSNRRPADFVPHEWADISNYIEAAVRHWLVPRPHVFDDSGKSYKSNSRIFSGTMAYRCSAIFEPGVGPDVRVLTVGFEDVSFTVSIPIRV